MGNALASSADGGANELPAHAVTVGAYFIGRHEVTNAQWDEVQAWAASHGYSDLAAGTGKAADHPLQAMAWQELVKWCNAASEKAGLTPCYSVAGQTYRVGVGVPDCNWNANGYRLPTEAEWEKAARGGARGRRFAWGDTISHREANFRNEGAETYQAGRAGDHPAAGAGAEPYTTPVGTFAANGYGLFDVAGNVAEWCWDWYGPYPDQALSDPRGAAAGTLRVYRGGSWRHNASDCRSADRYFSYPAGSYNYVGLRVARSCPP
jgi:formylglycine-generating enzyme required for sulfatase activity